MPKSAFVRRPVAIASATAVVAGTVAVLLVSPGGPVAGAVAAPGSTLRASVTNAGEQARQGGDESALSENGTAVAFTSREQLDNLGTDGRENVFVRDLARNRTVMISRGRLVRDEPTIGVAPPPLVRYGPEKHLDLNAPLPTRRQQEPPPIDTPANGDSTTPSISADGRFVSFITNATNVLWADAYTDAEIFIVDRDPDADGNFDENLPSGVRDYRYIPVLQGGFGSYEYARAAKLAANGSRIVWIEGEGASYFLTARLNLPAGQVDKASQVPADIGLGSESLAAQYDPAISSDGNFVVGSMAYWPDCECSQIRAIVSTDMRTGTATRVDIDVDNEPVGGFETEDLVMRPAVSGDGRRIAFVGELFEGRRSRFNQPNVYVVDVDYSRPANQRVTRTVIASRNNAGALVNGELPGLSADGRYLAFVTDSPNAHDGTDAPVQTSTCIKPPPPPTSSAPPVPRLGGEPLLRLNAALPPERPEARTFCQVVVRDLVIDQTNGPRLVGTLVSPNTTGNAGNGNTVPDRHTSQARLNIMPPSLSGTGGRIAYDSAAGNLVADDTNQRDDVFVRTLQPDLRASTLNFGQVEVGQGLVRTVAVSRVGAGPLGIGTVSLTGPNAADFEIIGQTCQNRTLHQTETCGVTIEFRPSTATNRTAQLVVDAPGIRRVVVDLTGVGTEKPVPRGAEFSAAPVPLEFGQRPLLSAGPEGVITVTNTGESPLLISSVLPVGPGAPGDYSIGTNTCAGTPVPGGGTCRVSVKFSPTLPGDRSATLQFTHNVAGSTQTLVAVRGSAGPMTLEANPGVTPPGRVVTITGKGYPPGKTVTVAFAPIGLSPAPPGKATATVGADGLFRASLMIFHKSKPETRTAVATVDGSPALFANAQLLVVFPTVSPAEFVVRG